MRPLTLTATIVALLVAPAASAREEESPLPDAGQVKTITIKFDHPKLDTVEFAATPDDWKAIRATLLPAKRDPNPADWEWVGTVRIVDKDQQPFRVELYAPSKGAAGAFAAGKTFKQRVYCRGGKTAELIKAIHAAYEKSQESDE